MNTSRFTILLLAIILFGLFANICGQTTKKPKAIALLKNNMKIVLKDMADMKRRLEQVEKEIHDYLLPVEKKNISNLEIAFQACTKVEKEFKKGDRLPFSESSYNEGGHYNVIDNVYTCPYNGLYKFSINLLSAAGKNCTAGFKSDKEISDKKHGIEGIAWVSGISEKRIQGSNSITFKCKKGQKVWVEAVQDGMIYGEKETCLSSFSGILYAFEDDLNGNTGVAFQSCATSSQEFENKERLNFPSNVYNFGDKYNTTDSTFTCPVRGIYQFSMNFLSEADRHMIASFRTDRAKQPQGVVRVIKDDTKLQTSNTVIFDCKVDQKIWIEGGTDANSNMIYGNDKLKCVSSFSGKLLQFPNGIEMPSGKVMTQVGTEVIAFEGCANTKQDIKSGDKLNFQSNVFNTNGNNYDAETSEFECPRDGLYEFSITIISDGSNALSVGIRAESWNGLRGEVFVSKTDRKIQVSNSYMFKCLQGTLVWVEAGTIPEGSETFERDGVKCHTKFSGKLLAPEYE